MKTWSADDNAGSSLLFKASGYTDAVELATDWVLGGNWNPKGCTVHVSLWSDSYEGSFDVVVPPEPELDEPRVFDPDYDCPA